MSSARALDRAARIWLAVAVLGQWLFFYYIAAFYGSSTLRGDFQVWTKNKFLFKGYVPGDRMGNLAFAAHALLAGIIAFGGALQIIPYLRTRFLALHRWNGRLFFVTAFGVSLSGLYMNWFRGAQQSVIGAIGTSVNGVLIMLCAAIAWRTAVMKDVTAHRRWALRAYLVANGQWFIRVGYIAWMMANHGHDRGFFRIWTFGCYLVPLAVLELYFRAREGGTATARFAMAAALVALTLVMALGIVGFTAFTWQKILSRL